MKKISIVLPNREGGAAERLAIYLANDWVGRGFKVEMVLMKKHGELLSILRPEILIIDLKAKRFRNGILRLYKYFKSSLSQILFGLVCGHLLQFQLYLGSSRNVLV